MNRSTRIILSLTLPALLVGFVILFSWVLYWNGDPVLYQFVYQDRNVYFTWEPIMDFHSLWLSITRHYMEVNGRFVCHFLVMTAVSFLPQWLISIVNGLALAALLLMVCRLAKIGIESWKGVWSVTLMGWLAFDNLTDPAFYINYIWMASVVVAWIMMFLSHPKVRTWVLLPIGIFSFIAGQAHECFALPIGLALIVYLIDNRFKVSNFDWVAGLCFCVAGLTTFISPGLLIRISETAGDFGNIIPPRYDLFLELILPVVFAIVLIRYRKQLSDYFSSETNRFWLWIIIGNFILSFATFGRYGTRAFTIGSAGIIILVLDLLPRHRLNLFGFIFFILLTVWNLHLRWYYTFSMKDKYEYVYNRYKSQRCDTVWIPDELYIIESRTCDNLGEHPLRRMWRDENDSDALRKGRIKVLPEALKSIPRDFKGNICRKVAPNVYLLIQSRENPARFVSRKRILPGVLDWEFLPAREIIIGENKDETDIFLDSSLTWKAAFYTNEYVRGVAFDLIMLPPKEDTTPDETE